MDIGMVGIFIAALVIMAIIIYIKANMKICEPNEVMIFSGRQFKDKDKEVVVPCDQGRKRVKDSPD